MHAPRDERSANTDFINPLNPVRDSKDFTDGERPGGAEHLPLRDSGSLLHFLARASHSLAQSLDYENTLVTLAGMTLPYLGSWCVVDVVEADGSMRRLGVVHPDPRKRELIGRLTESWPPHRDDPLGVPRAILSRASEVIPHVSDEMLVEVARSEENLRDLRALGIGSVVVVPLLARDNILGAITFVSADVGHQYAEADVQLAEDLAAHCAIALDNARLFGEMTEARHEAEVARERAAKLNEQLVVASIRQQELAEEAHEATRVAQRALTATELSEERFSRTIAIAAEAIISVDESQRITLFNEGAEHIFGYRKREIMGQPLALLLPEGLRALHEQHVRAFGESPEIARRMGRRGEISGRRKDGEEFPAEASISKLDVGGKRIYTVVLRDTTEARNAALEKEKLLIAATQATEERARLIRGITHDIKNPLGAADGYAELLEMELRGTLLPEQGKMVAGVRRGIRTALGIISDLLDLSLAKSSELALNRTPTDLAAVAAAAVEDYRGAAEAAGHELVWEESVPMPIGTDPGRVREVLGNLLANAIKYTPPPGRITVWIAKTTDEGTLGPGEWIAVHVRDNGPGIPPEARETIFGEFQRLHSTRQASGHGVGLAISRMIARRLGGQLTVSGEAGEGATFSIWLPVTAPAP